MRDIILILIAVGIVLIVGAVMLYKVSKSTDQYKINCVNKGGEVLNVYRGYVCVKPGVIIK